MRSKLVFESKLHVVHIFYLQFLLNVTHKKNYKFADFVFIFADLFLIFADLFLLFFLLIKISTKTGFADVYQEISKNHMSKTTSIFLFKRTNI